VVVQLLHGLFGGGEDVRARHLVRLHVQIDVLPRRLHLIERALQLPLLAGVLADLDDVVNVVVEVQLEALGKGEVLVDHDVEANFF